MAQLRYANAEEAIIKIDTRLPRVHILILVAFFSLIIHSHECQIYYEMKKEKKSFMNLNTFASLCLVYFDVLCLSHFLTVYLQSSVFRMVMLN